MHNTIPKPLLRLSETFLRNRWSSSRLHLYGDAALLVGPFPPPTHGQAVATDAFYASLLATEHVGTIFAVNTSEGEGTRFEKICRKFARNVRALAAVAKTQYAFAYISVNSGRGVLITSALALAARLRRSPLILHHHSYNHISRRTSWSRTLVKASGPSATHVVLSDAMRAIFESNFATLGPVRVLNNAGLIQRTLANVPVKKSPGGIIIGHLSNLSGPKGISDVVELAIKVRSTTRRCSLIVAGPVTDVTAQREIQRARRTLGDQFRHLGAVNANEKDRFFSSIDYFVFPTRSPTEASPLVVLEALAAGVPVITRAQGAISEMIEPPGGVCISRDANFVSEALDWLLRAHDYGEESDAARASFARQRSVFDAQFSELLNAIGDGGRTSR